MTPKQRATRAAEAMWSQDGASQWLGMTLVSVDEGSAVMSLTVQKHHCNGHGMCHGGFAFACNSRNQSTVAQNNMITYTAPAQVGDVLTATAHEVSLTGRSGIYDVRVANQHGKIIAEMRGLSRAIKGELFVE